MGIFGPKRPGSPQIRIVKQGAGSRVLDFSEFMDQDMKKRIKTGVLEWMDKVDIFEAFYIPKRESEGWTLIKGNYRSANSEDRFKATWQVGDDQISATYNDGKFTVTERLKISRK
jgi:hypothetical protein